MVFYLGGDPASYSNVDDASKPECRPVQELEIVDTLKGAIKEDANGDVQFLLVPRETALKMYRRSVFRVPICSAQRCYPPAG